jgi:hypothetical protein
MPPGRIPVANPRRVCLSQTPIDEHTVSVINKPWSDAVHTARTTERHSAKTTAQAAMVFARWCRRPGQAWFRAMCRERLAGLHLACYCPLDAPCHHVVLLAIANSDEEE